MLAPIPNCLTNRILWCIGEAERLKGSAPTNPEYIAVFRLTYTNWIPKSYLLILTQSLYREDLLYADRDFTVWSLTGPDGSKERADFELMSEKFNRIYKGYKFEPHNHIRALPETPALNLKQLEALLLSKDQELWERNRWIFEADGGYFLDG